MIWGCYKKSFWGLVASDVCQGGPGTMLPIWKQHHVVLDDLMDGEISSGCPAELANIGPINHPSPVSTDGQPSTQRPAGQGFCQGIFSFLHTSLDHSEIRMITLKGFLWYKCSLCVCLLPLHFCVAIVICGSGCRPAVYCLLPSETQSLKVIFLKLLSKSKNYC